MRRTAHISKRRRASRSGMTLIEIMVVIIIIALAAGGISMAIGALTRTKLRSGCVKVMAACRFAYNRAISQGNTVRLRLNMEDHTMSLEEAHGRVTLSRVDDPRREGANEQAGEDGAGVDPWAAAQARLSETFQPTFGASPFGPITGRNGETLEKYQTQSIGSGVAVHRLFLPHEPEPREEGIGAVYFFPGGMTEHAVIQLTDGSETVYAVELHPLTGRARLHDWAYEPEDLSDADDEELSEVRDPG